MRHWIGVDLDGTLAHYEPGEPYDPTFVGEPIPLMVERVKGWIAEGREVRILTARMAVDSPQEHWDVRSAIQDWCAAHLGKVLEVTCIKDHGMIELWDDRAVRVVKNVGTVSSQEEFA